MCATIRDCLLMVDTGGRSLKSALRDLKKCEKRARNLLLLSFSTELETTCKLFLLFLFQVVLALLASKKKKQMYPGN